MAIAPLLILTSCANQAGLSKLNKYLLNKPKKAFNTAQATALNQGYIDSLNDFSLDFIQQVNEGSPENPIFSPVSIATCFSMAYDAAEEKTKEELGKLLHYDETKFNHLDEIKNALLRSAIDDSKNKTYLNISQSFWIDTMSSLDEEYLKTLQDYYFAEAYQGNLSNMYNEVADWINAKTKKYLNVKGEDFKDMLQGALYALLNTVYLKASWYYDFEEKNNTTEQFANLDKSNSRATFMNNIEDGYYYASNDYKIAALPFKDGLWFRMLLPEKGTNYAEVLNDRTALEKLLTVSLDEERTDENGGVFRDEISYKLPQFKVRSAYDLIPMFVNMGVKSPFIPGVADFPRLSNGYISAAKHDAGFEANNQGVEGAAYTIIVVSKEAIPEPEPIRFHCDRPFAYAVTTKEGIPVFMGEITNIPNA